MAVVLVVEDHIGIAQAVATLARMSDCEAAIAHSGEKALEYLRAHPVDAVVMDVKMTGMSGLDVLRELGAAGRLPQLPVLMYSASDEWRDESLQLGAAAFVRKDEVDALPALLKRYAGPPRRATA